MKNKNYIRHATYLRNSIAYYHDFWYTCIKWYLHSFKILFFRIVSAVKGQKITQNDKKLCLSKSISQEPYIIWLWFLVHIWKNDGISRSAFCIFKILILRFVRMVKGQKMAQIDKKFCHSRFVSQEPYIIWLRFLVHMCKMMISPPIFFFFFFFFNFFKSLIFRVFMTVKGKKTTRN